MDPITIAALASGGASLASGLFGASGAKKTESLYRGRTHRSLANFIRPLDELWFGNMEEQLRNAQAAETGGYDQSLANLSMVGRGLRRDAITRSQQDLAQGQQGLSGAGLGSSTLAQNYRTGAASSLSRDLTGIDRSLADLRNNLLVGRGQAQARGFSSLADLYGRRQSRDAELEQMRYLATIGQFGPGGQGVSAPPPLDLSGIAKFASLFAKGGGAG